MSESDQERDKEIDPELTDTISGIPQTAELNRSIGPYRLLQKIGEGGMGTVFVAEQTEPVRRKVALKVIKAGIGSKDILARFESERQALALMSHPNIARILDAGTTEKGEPYFVMELVDGIPIIQYCQQSNLSIRERIELFKIVCDAIHHAHQKGIMHRDIKSSNILVEIADDKPTVKVIDFGLAKAVGQQLTEKTLFTEFGQVVGTLEYMSPEQANLNSHDVDIRTDIYSLGVLLYELLTGSTPLEKSRIKSSALDQILRMIREEEAELPSARLSRFSTVAQAEEKPSDAANGKSESSPSDVVISPKDSKCLRGELDWIVMKTLEKDRSRRYDSASSLAGDLENFLAGNPVEARPYSFTYRLKKSIAKHRSLYAAGTAIALVLLLGIIGTSIGMYRAIKAESVTREQFKKIESQKLALDSQLLKIQEANDRANRHVAEIRDVLKQFGDRADGEPIARNANLNSYREKTFLTVLNHFQLLVEEYPSNPELRFELGKAFYGLGYFYRSVHSAKQSSENYLSAIANFEQLLNTQFKRELVATQLAMTYQNLASVMNLRGLDGNSYLHKAQDIWTDLAKNNPAESRFRRNKILVRSQIATQNYYQGQIDLAIGIEKQNVEALVALMKAQPENQDFEFLLTTIYGRLANWEIDRKKFVLSRQYAASAFEIGKRLSTKKKDFESRSNLVNILNTWSIALKGDGDYQSALGKRKEALSIARELYDEHPDSMAAKHSLGMVLSNLTYDYGFLEKRELARESINECITIRERLSREYPENASYFAEYAKSLSLSAAVEKDLGNTSLASERIQQSVQMLEKVSNRLPNVKEFAKWLKDAKSIQKSIADVPN